MKVAWMLIISVAAFAVSNMLAGTSFWIALKIAGSDLAIYSIFAIFFVLIATRLFVKTFAEKNLRSLFLVSLGFTFFGTIASIISILGAFGWSSLGAWVWVSILIKLAAFYFAGMIAIYAVRGR